MDRKRKLGVKQPAPERKEPLETSSPLTHRLLFALGLALLSLFISTWCISHKRQLRFMGGMAEEYFFIAARLEQTGRFSLSEGDTLLFRPPGYCYLLSKAIALSGGLPDLTRMRSQKEVDQATHAVLPGIYLVQACLLAAAVLVFSLWSAELYSTSTAAIVSVAFCCCPYFTILTGLLQYPITHIFTLLISGYVLFLAFTFNKFRKLLFLLAGLLFGISTLVRPITLLMPAFVALSCILYFRRAWAVALMYITLFTIGMSAVIAPWTYRNYLLSHRFIPVNAQSGAAFYAATLKRLPFTANHYRFWLVFYNDGASVYSEATGGAALTTTNYIKYNLVLEDAYAAATKKNLLRQPDVYISNLVTNAGLMLLGANSVFIQVFEAIQNRFREVDKGWFEVGNEQRFYYRTSRTIFEWINALLVISLLGGYMVRIRMNWRVLMIASLPYACVMVAHIVTHADLMYYYVKMPFVFLLSGFLFDKCLKGRRVLGLDSDAAYWCVGLLVIGLNVVLCIRVIIL